MKYHSRVLIMLVAAISILLLASPACAADRSVTFGMTGLLMLGLEYERGLSASTSCCFALGSTPIITDLGFGLGMRWYNDNALMDGKYYGLYAGYGEGSFLSHYHTHSIQGILGYKKAFDTGLTFDAGLGPFCLIDDDGDTIFGAAGVLMLGYSW